MSLSRRVFLVGSAATLANSALSQDPPVPVPIPQGSGSASRDYFECVETHFDRFIHYSMDRFGATRSAIWMSSLDIGTNELLRIPTVLAAKDPQYIPGAYWYADQPMLVAAHAVATRSSCKCYSDAVDEYLRSYFHLVGDEVGLADHGQIYWDAHLDKVVRLEVIKRMGMWHTPAWETLWRVDRERVSKLIRDHAADVIANKRSAIGEVVIAVDSLAWLARQDDDVAGSQKSILAIAKRTLAQRQPVDSDAAREDLKQSVRFSASCLRSAKQFDNEALRQIGLKYTEYSLKSALHGVPRVAIPPRKVTAVGMELVQSCLAMSELADSAAASEIVNLSCESFETIGDGEMPEVADAGSYGRLISFAVNASRVLQRPPLLEFAKQMADDAIEKLFVSECGMFRSRVGVDRCDAKDGIGHLMLALLEVAGEKPTAKSAFAF